MSIAQFQTPRGELRWANISGEGKANQSGKLKYSIDLLLAKDSDEGKALKAQIDEFWKDNLPNGWNVKRKAKSMGYRSEVEKVLDEEGNETYDDDGNIVYRELDNWVFTFQTDTTYAKSGDAKVIKIYNAKGRPVSLGDKKIGNGSIGQVGGAMGIYTVKDDKGKVTDAGVTLYLNSVRINKLEEYTGGEDQWGDTGEEDGWTGEDDSFEGELDNQANEAKVKL